MLIRDGDWNRIRERFSEAEKAGLRKAVGGGCICPAGVFVEEEDLSGGLRAKLDAALKAPGGRMGDA